jgi:hypothetical protein
MPLTRPNCSRLTATVQTNPGGLHGVGSERTGVVVGEQKEVVGVGVQGAGGLLTIRDAVDGAFKAGGVYWQGRESGLSHTCIELGGGLSGGARRRIDDDDVDRLQDRLAVDPLAAVVRDLSVGLQ